MSSRRADTADDEERTHADRKAVYETVLRVVEYQTGGRTLTDRDVPEGETADSDLRMQPPGATSGVVVNIIACPERDEAPEPKYIRRALRAAVEQDDLIQWTAAGGAETRYTRMTVDDVRYLHTYMAKTGARELTEWAHAQLQKAKNQ